EVDQYEFRILAGNYDFPRIDRLGLQAERFQVQRKDRDDQPLSKRTDEVARTDAHFAQQRYAGEYLVDFFPQTAVRFLQFVNDVAILEQLVYGAVMTASDFPKLVVPQPRLSRYGRFTSLQRSICDSSHRRNNNEWLGFAK